MSVRKVTVTVRGTSGLCHERFMNPRDTRGLGGLPRFMEICRDRLWASLSLLVKGLEVSLKFSRETASSMRASSVDNSARIANSMISY